MMICPYCEEELEIEDIKVESKKHSKYSSTLYYYCPECEKILSVSDVAI